MASGMPATIVYIGGILTRKILIMIQLAKSVIIVKMIITLIRKIQMVIKTEMRVTPKRFLRTPPLTTARLLQQQPPQQQPQLLLEGTIRKTICLRRQVVRVMRTAMTAFSAMVLSAALTETVRAANILAVLIKVVWRMSASA